MSVEIDISLPSQLFHKNDILITGHLNIDLTGYKIRAEIFDTFGTSIKFATANDVDGSDDQIEVTDESNGYFWIKVAKETTEDLHFIAYFEIEIENPDGDVQTVYYAPLKFIDNIRIREENV